MAKDSLSTELVEKQIEALTAQINALEGKKPEHKPRWVKQWARVTAVIGGFANNRLYEQVGEEFEIIHDANTKVPAKWYELLGQGTPVDGPNSLPGSYDFAKADAPKGTRTGFAGSVQ